METIDLFKALSEEVRLRILRSVSAAELSVAELVRILGLPQSTVSRHLKPLRDAGLVETRREATSVYYKKGTAFRDPALAQLLNERLDRLPRSLEDLASVRRVMESRRQRSRKFFDHVAGSYGIQTEPGGGWQGLAAALAVGFINKEVADLGCGEGDLAMLLAPFAKRVVAVDQSPVMLQHVRDRAKRAGLDHVVDFVEGDVESVPLENESVHAVFLSQTLHHAADPVAAVFEAARILDKNGQLIILDLLKHNEVWVREEWADQWLGFELEELCKWMIKAGIRPVVQQILAGSTSELSVLFVVGYKDV